MAARERRVRHRLGRHLIDGAQMRSSPPIEELWNGTFNLRWWEHLEHERETGLCDAACPNERRVSI